MRFVGLRVAISYRVIYIDYMNKTPASSKQQRKAILAEMLAASTAAYDLADVTGTPADNATAERLAAKFKRCLELPVEELLATFADNK